MSITAPFVRTFCLARKRFEGVSRTFLIFTVFDFFVFGSIRFIVLEFNKTVFLFPPCVLIDLLFISPIFTIRGWRLSSYFFFLCCFLYFPPVIFLPFCMLRCLKIGLNIFLICFLVVRKV